MINVLRRGSTQFKITWVQQRQHHRAHDSARERMLSLALSAWTDLEESVAVEVADRRKSCRLPFSLRCEEYIGKQKGVVLGLCKSKELILVKRSKEENRRSFLVLHYERGNWSREYLVSPSVNGKFCMTHLCSNKTISCS